MTSHGQQWNGLSGPFPGTFQKNVYIKKKEKFSIEKHFMQMKIWNKRTNLRLNIANKAPLPKLMVPNVITALDSDRSFTLIYKFS